MMFRSKNAVPKSRRIRRRVPLFTSRRLGRALRVEELACRCMLSGNAGALDPTFGDGGKVVADLNIPTSAQYSFEFGSDVKVYQLNGETKLVVAGQFTEVYDLGYDEN